MIEVHPTLYKRDSNGSIREWRMERDGSQYRTVSGVRGSVNQVESFWKQANGRGVGKAKKTDEEQAIFEIGANYTAKLSSSYHAKIETIDQPVKFDPMLAGTYKDWAAVVKIAGGKRKWSQPKLDGMRASVSEKAMMSRNGKPILGAPHILEDLKEFFEQFPDAVLDGELYNHLLKEDFNTIISCVKKKNPDEYDLVRSKELVQYWVYDISSSPDPFGLRTEWIRKHLPLKTSIVLVDTDEVETQAQLDHFNARYAEEVFEGQMIRIDEVYINDRTKFLLKRKEFMDEEFELVSINEGQGNWAGVAKSVTCRLPDGRTFNAGIKGTRERAKELLHETYPYVTIKFFNYTPDGKPRFGVATKFWDDEAAALDRSIARKKEKK